MKRKELEQLIENVIRKVLKESKTFKPGDIIRYDLTKGRVDFDKDSIFADKFKVIKYLGDYGPKGKTYTVQSLKNNEIYDLDERSGKQFMKA